MTELAFSPLESARFGLRVFRAQAESIDATALAQKLRRDQIDIAILRVPAASIDAIDALRAHGFEPIVADTVVHFDIVLPSPDADIDESVVLRPANAADAAVLESMAHEIFAGYVTHYHANPLLDPADILDGYGEWAARHVREPQDGASAWIVERDGKAAGFSCYRIERDTGLAIGVLNGVLPSFRGRGVYRAMLRQMLKTFAAQGLRRFAIATQIQNAAVQHIWAREGLSLRRADNTVHINALLGGNARMAMAERARPA